MALDIVIAGGHGQIALRLATLLHERGDRVRALIRNPAHADDVAAAGAAAVVCDLEHADGAAVAEAVSGADAVLFAAGAGPGSGPERKWTVDHGGAVALLAAAQAAGVGRYVMVSAMAADPGAPGDDDFAVYLRAKGQADADLRASGIAHVIVRPGRLTDDPGTGLVTAAPHVERGAITRDDTAAVLAAVLHDPALDGVTFEVVGGDTPVDAALAALRP